MKDFPYYKQVNNRDCGMTCLRMIAKYYGKSSDVLEMTSLTKAHRKGVDFQQLKNHAETIGFKVSANRMPIHALTKVDLPAIIPWNKNHFVVLIEINKNQYHIADPARGMITLSQQEFLPLWKDAEYSAKHGGAAMTFSE